MSILGDLGLGLGKVLGGGVSNGTLYDEVPATSAVSHRLQQLNQVLNNAASQANLQPYVSAMNNQLQPVQPQWAAAQASVQSYTRMPQMTMNISTMKLNAQVLKLVDQLPMSIAGSIDTCAYYERDPDEAARFVVMFSNGHKLTFYDVDAFPSAEQIGRIALECP